MLGKSSKKRWVLAFMIVGLALGAACLYAIGRITNRDRLVVLNSNLEILSGSDLTKEILLDPTPRDLSNEEVDRIKGLLNAANRHLTRDIYGRSVRIQVVVDPQLHEKRLIARSPE
jgi:hypothetical protein